MIQSQKPGAGFNIDQKINVKIHKNIGYLNIECSYFRESADIVRGNYKHQTEKEFLESETRRLFEIFCFPQERKIESVFKDPKIEVLSDDKKANKIQVRYMAELNNPYTPTKKKKMFRCYYLIQVDKIKNYNHKDSLCSSFVFYPIRYKFNFESDLFIKRNTQVLKRQTRLDNPHFLFLNQKKVWNKKLEVITEYSPKNYDSIKPENLERIKNDLKVIENSNFGAGVVLGNFLQYLIYGYY